MGLKKEDMHLVCLNILATVNSPAMNTRTEEWIKKMCCIYTMEYYSATRKNECESVLVRWMNPEPVIHSERSQKEKNKYHILMHVYRI